MFVVSEFLADEGYAARSISAAGGELLTRCPECSKEKLYVNAGKGLCFCQRCQFKGNFVTLVAAITGVTRSEAFAIVGMERAEISDAPAPKLAGPCTLPSGFHLLDDTRDERQLPYWDYLVRQRQLSMSLVRRYQIGYCDYGFYGGRVVIPVNHEGELVSWVARDILGRAAFNHHFPKVLTPPGGNQSEYLFNLDRAEDSSEVVITEGVFDALRAPSRAVATFGKRLSPHQRRRLVFSGVRQLVIAWDRDAYAEALSLACDLRFLFDVRVAKLGAKDPGEMSEADFHRTIERAESADLSDLLAERSRLLREKSYAN